MQRIDISDIKVEKEVSRFDMDYVISSLQSLWRKDKSADKIKQAFENSVSLGLFYHNRQVGFVRAVTDGCIISWICDLFIDQDYRRMGLGKMLMKELLEHPQVKDTRVYLAATEDATRLYEGLGFSFPQTVIYRK